MQSERLHCAPNGQQHHCIFQGPER